MYFTKPAKQLTRLSIFLLTTLALIACSSDVDVGVASDAIANTSEISFVVPLTSAQEVPPVLFPEASGEASLTLNSLTGELSGTIAVSGLTGQASMAHIHKAPLGEIGPVIVGLESNTDGSLWTIPTDTVLDTPQISDLTAGNMYFNVHTEANPEGELRGQIGNTKSFTVRQVQVSIKALVSQAQPSPSQKVDS